MIDPDVRRKALKTRDAWWTVLVIDPLSLPVLAVLVRFPWVTPLKLTTVGALLGVASVLSFLQGHLVQGAILFELRFFFDCLDGKLARVQGSNSPRGAYLDLTMDVILVSAAIGALGWNLGHRSDFLPLGVTAACTFACLILFWLILFDIDHPVAAAITTPTPESPLNRWLRHRRLDRLPHNVEVETMLLFVAPIIGDLRLLALCFVVALTYYVLAATRLFLRLYKRVAPPLTSNG